MAHVNVAGHQHGLHGFGQIQQAQQVAGCTARTAHSLRRGFVSESKLFDQALEAKGLFQWVEIFTLDVLNQGHGRSGLVGDVAYQHRHFIQAR